MMTRGGKNDVNWIGSSPLARLLHIESAAVRSFMVNCLPHSTAMEADLKMMGSFSPYI